MCLTCQIIKGDYIPPGGIVYEDRYVMLHHCIDVAIPGYLILSPKQHTEYYAELSDDTVYRLARVSKVVELLLFALPGVGKVYIACFGEQSSHFHFHFLPRYDWLVAAGKQYALTREQLDGAKLFSWARQQYKVSPEELFTHDIITMVNNLRQQCALLLLR